MANETISVGFIGAGANTGLRHIPGLRAQEGVELVGVANRSLESSQTAADKYEIGEAYPTWLDLVEDPDIDAVCIGTWPYMHSTINPDRTGQRQARAVRSPNGHERGRGA